jgi:hypothetical protein
MYNDRMSDWYDITSVCQHAGPLRESSMLNGEFVFPPELMPILKHPIVQAVSAETREAILAERIQRYLEFTVLLETKIVNPVIAGLAVDDLGLHLPEPMQDNAFKLATEEAFHAVRARELQRWVEHETSIRLPHNYAPPFMVRLADMDSRLPADDKPILRLFAVIVSETLISSILSIIPHDHRICSQVREVVGEHAIDEGRHFAYFANVLHLCWPRLTSHQQRTVGLLIPGLIMTFLEPDCEDMASILMSHGIRAGDARRAVEDSYPRTLVESDARQSARNTLRELYNNEVLADREIWNAFRQVGLVE